MKRGFTILELLVASLLLGMLVTVLTMLFNQSSISWRTGTSVVADLDRVRNNIATVRDEADNIIIWNDEVHRIVNIWDDNGDLRQRAWDVEGESKALKAELIASRGGSLKDDTKLSDIKSVSVGSGGTGRNLDTYVINVKCAGSDREFNTYDDIWSYPDEIN